MRWWPFRRRNGGRYAAREQEARAERLYREETRRWPQVQRVAGHLADLPAEEFAERVAQAFRRRP